MATVDSITNRLVHIHLALQVDNQNEITSVMVRERPFIGELNLDIDPDNLSLLIAVGEVMGVAQPLTVSRISCIGRLAILWLDLNRWLVLPQSGSKLSVRQALYDTFGQDIRIDTDNERMHAELTEAALRYLLESENTQEGRQQGDSQRSETLRRLRNDGITILAPADQQEYDILVRDRCAERLWQWLSQEDSHEDARRASA
jgi:hypothetical protein